MIAITDVWGNNVFKGFSNSLKNLIGRGSIWFLIGATYDRCISKPSIMPLLYNYFKSNINVRVSYGATSLSGESGTHPYKIFPA